MCLTILWDWRLKGSHFFPMFFFILLKTSKPKVLCFQGDQKGTLESKGLVKHHFREYKRFLEYLVCIPVTGDNYIQGLQKSISLVGLGLLSKRSMR